MSTQSFHLHDPGIYILSAVETSQKNGALLFFFFEIYDSSVRCVDTCVWFDSFWSWQYCKMQSVDRIEIVSIIYSVAELLHSTDFPWCTVLYLTRKVKVTIVGVTPQNMRQWPFVSDRARVFQYRYP